MKSAKEKIITNALKMSVIILTDFLRNPYKTESAGLGGLLFSKIVSPNFFRIDGIQWY